MSEEVNVIEEISPHLATYFEGVEVKAGPVHGARYERCAWSRGTSHARWFRILDHYDSV